MERFGWLLGATLDLPSCLSQSGRPACVDDLLPLGYCRGDVDKGTKSTMPIKLTRREQAAVESGLALVVPQEQRLTASGSWTAYRVEEEEQKESNVTEQRVKKKEVLDHLV